MVIDIDKPATWPDEVLTLVQGWCRTVAANTDSIGSLGLAVELEDQLRGLIAELPVRAYHCTRILPHEADSIRSEGLKALTPELVEARITLAEQHGDMDPEEARKLRSGTAFSTGNTRGRANQVCLILSANQFVFDPADCSPLLAVWGGEGMHGGPLGGSKAPATIKDLGRPAIIQVAVKLGGDWNHHRTTPGLHNVFVASVLNVPDLTGLVYYRDSIPGGQVEAISHPGSPFYDRFVGLPQR